VGTIPGSLNFAFDSLTNISKNSYLQRALSGLSSNASSSTLVAMKSLSIVANPTFLSSNLQESQKLVKSIQLMLGKLDLQMRVMKMFLS
jgi:hypothetical protein